MAFFYGLVGGGGENRVDRVGKMRKLNVVVRKLWCRFVDVCGWFIGYVIPVYRCCVLAWKEVLH